MTDGIEYEGIADDRSIRAGSDRCFRDYSPGDTVLSLSDDGRAIYTGPVPSFQSPASIPEGEEDHRATTTLTPSKATEAGPDLVPLSHDTLATAGSRRSSGGSSSSSSSRTPLGRFRRDEQPYEKLAVQLSATTATPDLSSSSSTTPPRRYDSSSLLPGEGVILAANLGPVTTTATRTGDDDDVDVAMSMSMPHPRRQPPLRRPDDIPLPPSAPPLPRSVLASASAAAAAEELRERTRFMKSPAWGALASEEQTKYIHEVFLLRRRVRAVELPRESKAVRVRKRKHPHGSGASESASGSGSGLGSGSGS